MIGDLRSTTLADLHLQVRIGGDAALMKGLIKTQVAHDATDMVFINEKTTGFQAMMESTLGIEWSRIEQDSGVSREEIERAGAMLAGSKATIACWAMGLTQHRNGVAVIQEVVNLLLMNGHVGRKGAGFCPVRGHSNVQGDRTVGIWEAPTESFLATMETGLGLNYRENTGTMWSTPFRPCSMVRSTCSFAWEGTSFLLHPIRTLPQKRLPMLD